MLLKDSGRNFKHYQTLFTHHAQRVPNILWPRTLANWRGEYDFLFIP